MPELPEVETIRRGLAKPLTGRRITKVEISRFDLRYPVPTDLPIRLQGQALLKLSRRSKYLCFGLSQGTMLVHLGMSGRLRLYAPQETHEAAKHDHVLWQFDDGCRLVLNDPRRFGAVLYTTDPLEEHPRIRILGPEPLSPAFSGQYLYEMTRKSRMQAHPWIMSAKNVVGVGNIYAQESLFKAGIRPDRQVSRLSRQACSRWQAAIVETLSHAIEHGGSTLRDYQTSSGEMGYFQQYHNVYGRSGQACRRCNTTLQGIRLQNRSSAYCPSCQR